jgi:hypothetical protein
MSEIERTNLDAHVSLCELRYQSLERRLADVETQLGDVKILLSEIRDNLARQPAREIQRWFHAQWWLIGILGAVAGWALRHLLIS